MMDDDEARQLLATHFSAAHVDAFDRFPIGVMRADFWRYCVMYRFGGVYADVDTICERPVESWLRVAPGLVVAAENDEHLCQWTFAARPNHPALASLIDTIIRMAHDETLMRNLSAPHFVHRTTGPAVFTDAILRHLSTSCSNQGACTSGLHSSTDILVLPRGFFDGVAVRHVFGSIEWQHAPWSRLCTNTSSTSARMPTRRARLNPLSAGRFTPT